MNHTFKLNFSPVSRKGVKMCFSPGWLLPQFKSLVLQSKATHFFRSYFQEKEKTLSCISATTVIRKREGKQKLTLI